MSITGIRNFFGKQMQWLMIGLGILMLLSMGAYFGNRGLGGGPNAGTNEVFAVIEGEPVTRADFDASVKKAESQSGGRVTPEVAFRARVSALRAIVDQKAMVAEAKRRKIRVDDTMVINTIKDNIAKAIQQQKKQFVAQQKLTPDATDAQVKELIRKENDVNPDETIKKQIEAAEQDLQKPDLQQEYFDQVATVIMQKQVQDEVKVTEQDYLRANEPITMRKILINKAPHPDAKQLIDKALQEIKSGTPFGDVAEKYSDEKPAGLPGQQQLPKGQDPPISRNSLEFNPALKSLYSKDVGYRSDVMDLGTAYAIYTILKVDPAKTPKDFEKNKSAILEEYRSNRGGRHFDEWQRSKLITARVEFRSDVWKLYYQFMISEVKAYSSEDRLAPEQKVAQQAELMKKCEPIVDKKGTDWQDALLMESYFARMIASDPATKDLKLKDEATAIHDKTLPLLLDAWPDPSLRMEYAAELIVRKEYAKALKNIRKAQKMAYNPTNQEDIGIQTKCYSALMKLQKEGVKDPELDKGLSEFQTFQAKAMEIMQKQQEQQRKQQAEMDKARKEIQDKRKAEAAGQKPAPGSADKKPSTEKPKDGKSK